MMASKKFWGFTLTTYAVSWACWLPILSTLNADLFKSPALTLTLFLIGAYVPSLLGILFTYVFGEKGALKAMFKSAASLQIGGRSLLATFSAGPLLYSVATSCYLIFGGNVGAVNWGLIPWIPVIFIVPVIFGPLAEEFGWRGFALRQLDHKRQILFSSLVLGLVWAFWHSPLFWAATGTAISGFPVTIFTVGLFVLAVVGSSVLHTWLFNRTGGSVFGAIGLHWSMNACGTITGMLFPEMDLEQRFSLYQNFVIAIWMLVILIGLLKVAQARSNYGNQPILKDN